MLNRSSRYSLFPCLIFLLVIALVMPASSVLAKKRDKRPSYGKVVHELPRGHRTLHSRHGVHYYAHGIYYRPYDNGYRVIRPPVGIVIASLPLGYIDLNIGNRVYARYNDVYYRPVTRGYMVVEPPPSAPPAPQPDVTAIPANSLGQVTVNVEVLNVRSGPSRLQPVVDHVTLSDVLIVLATAPDWYYVRLPDGGYGWIWAEFARGQVNWSRSFGEIK